jgi:inner membrane protein
LDNVCHALVGAACVRARVAAPARLGLMTSVIAANLPDLDVLVFASDVPLVAFRRGWTHGVLAQAVMPAALAGLMFVAAKRRSGSAEKVALGPLILLSYLGVVLHVFMDYLNNYGVRFLMPFSGRWFYGDSLFIVDPWLWILFGTAVVVGGRNRVRAARILIAVAAAYILIMMGSARAAKSIVADAWLRGTGTPAQSLMVGPVPVNPFRKAVIIDAGDRYRRGTFNWFDRRTVFSDAAIEKNAGHPAVSVARHDRRIAGILVWARFPFWEIVPATEGTRVTVRDVRFTNLARGGFTATTIVH